MGSSTLPDYRFQAVPSTFLKDFAPMNTNRILLAVACCAALAACSKKETVKPEAPAETPAVTNTAPVDDGKYDPSDLDTDPCLIKRVVYSISTRPKSSRNLPPSWPAMPSI